jgi:hypothetical protein
VLRYIVGGVELPIFFGVEKGKAEAFARLLALTEF